MASASGPSRAKFRPIAPIAPQSTSDPGPPEASASSGGGRSGSKKCAARA